jgi:hypothetical protein
MPNARGSNATHHGNRQPLLILFAECATANRKAA